MEDLIYKEECYKIIGCAMEVHKTLGCGFLENVYKEALRYEFFRKGVIFDEERMLEIQYKDIILDKKYFADFVCFDKIILEIKAVERLCNEHYCQVINYLNAAKFDLGLLINFGASSLEYKRVITKKHLL